MEKNKIVTLPNTPDGKIAQSSLIICRVRVCRLSGVYTKLVSIFWEKNIFQTKFYRSSHNYGKALEFDSYGFKKNVADRDVVVYIVWGLEHRDMSACHFSDELCEGVQRYDDTFNPNTPEAQVALMVSSSFNLLNRSEIPHIKNKYNKTGYHEWHILTKYR